MVLEGATALKHNLPKGFRISVFEICVFVLQNESLSPQAQFDLMEICVPCKGGYTLLTFPHTITPYRDIVDGTRDHVTYQKLIHGNVHGVFGVLSVFGLRIEGMIWLGPEQVGMCNMTCHHRPLFSPSFRS
jgi:hypothetical protein